MNYDIERLILNHIITDDQYMRKVMPFIKKSYFEGHYRELFGYLIKFVNKYNKLPTQETFQIELKDNGFDQNFSNEVVPLLFKKEKADKRWLLDKTEEWCQNRAIHIAIMESINIIDGRSKEHKKDAIPSILTEALAVGFDTNIGHDYIEDFEKRYEFYHTDEKKIPFDLELFNIITSGGLSSKTLTIFLAGTGVGKSLTLCHMAAASISQGYNALYITAEMSEERIAERIDANILNIPINQIGNLSKDMFSEKINKLKTKTNGKLIIKEYPTGAAHVGHFRALLNELKLKREFIPDIIFVDYLNICASSRLKGMGGNVNSYSYVKAIAEEFRGLAVEFDVPIVSATQTTRSGFSNSDPGLEDTSESFGLPATADVMVALVSNEELDRDGQIMVKQLKNRYNDPNKHKRFILGIDKLHMRLMDADTDVKLTDDAPKTPSRSYGSKVIDVDEILF